MRFDFSSYVLSSGFSRKNIFESGSFKKQKRSTNQKIGFKAEKVNPAIQGEICLRWKENFHLYAMMAINNLMDTIKISDKFRKF